MAAAVTWAWHLPLTRQGVRAVADNNWIQFWEEHRATLGVSSFFAFAASGFIVKAREKVIAVSTWRLFLVVAAGQIVDACALPILVGVFGWHWLLAPAIGVVSGLTGIFVLLTVTRVAERVEDKSADIGDAAADQISKRMGP